MKTLLLLLIVFLSLPACAQEVDIYRGAMGVVTVQVHGVAGRAVRIEASSSLAAPFWEVVHTGTIGLFGVSLFDDSESLLLPARYYRVSFPPVATTDAAAAVEDEPVTVTLDGSDPFGGMLEAQITQLPAVGTLRQFDGTLISVPNTFITDPQRRVIYAPAQNGNGAAYASFSYVLRRGTTGIKSDERAVAVSVAAMPDGPLALTTNLYGTEDTPLIFHLDGSDPDAGDVLTPLMISAPNFGTIRQVAADGITIGAVLAPGDAATNPQGLLAYVPMAEINGAGIGVFSYRMRDSTGLLSPVRSPQIDLAPVNDAPVAQSVAHIGANDNPRTLIFPYVGDVETSGTAQLTVTFTQLPLTGVLEVSAPNVAAVPVQAGVAYPANSIFHYVAPVIFLSGTSGFTNYGQNFASFTYFATDAQGAVSAPATDAIHIVYHNLPPVIPAQTIAAVEDTPVWLIPTATDPDNNGLVFHISTLPQHGKVYAVGSFLLQPGDIFTVQIGTPDMLLYVPDADYHNTGGQPDSFQISVSDHHIAVIATIHIAVADRNDAPVLSGAFDTTAAQYDVNGAFIAPASVLGVTIADADATPAAVMRMTVRSVTGATSTTTGGGFVHLGNMNGITNFTRVSASHITFDGTLAALNTFIASGAILYDPDGSWLRLEVNDLGATQSDGLGTPLTGARTLAVTVEQEL